MVSRSRVMLTESTMQPISVRRLCLWISIFHRLVSRRRPSQGSLWPLFTRQLSLRNLTNFHTDPEQIDAHTAARLESIKTAEAIMDEKLAEFMLGNAITHEMITQNFNRLVEDLQHFRQHRDTESFKFQTCYSSHIRAKRSPAKCVDCFLHVEDLEHRYLQACHNIMKIMDELCNGILDSIERANTHQKMRGHLEASALHKKYLYHINLQRLEELKSMLQSLEDDAEAAKGWPQVSLSDGTPEDDQAPQNAGEGEDAEADDDKSSQVKSRKGKSRGQKKKKGRKGKSRGQKKKKGRR